MTKEEQKEIKKAYNREYCKKNKERIKFISAEWYKNNKEKVSIQNAERYKKNPNKKLERANSYYKENRVSKLCKKYNITSEIYQQLILEAKGRCYICQKEAKLNLDHNHKTGKVRKLLCRLCNLVLGMIDENPKIAINIANYAKSDGEEVVQVS